MAIRKRGRPTVAVTLTAEQRETLLRYDMHFTPTYSSWLNLVERWFSKLTNEALRRGSHSSTHDLKHAIDAYLQATNDEPKPFIWTKTAD